MFILRRIYCRAFQTAMRLAIPFLPYRQPKTVSSVQKLPDIIRKNNCSHPLLVTDSGIRSLGITAPLEKALKDNGIPCSVYDKTVPNPTTDNVEEARQLYVSDGCDCLIGFGGGSSMDCAKAVGARIAQPKKPLRKLKGILRVHRRLPLLMAIPTTAGTGSETTLAAVITDSKTHKKYTIEDFPLIPQYAVLDPEITVSLPPFTTAITGMDALTHAVEAYIGRSTTRDTRRDSLRAVKLIFANLETAVADGKNIDARKNMLRASYLAGCAFTKSYVGYVHAVGHPLSGEYGVPHGQAMAVLLPVVLEAYGTKIEKKLHRLAVAAGIASKDTPAEEAAERFIEAIREMGRKFGVGDSFDCIRVGDIGKMSKYADEEGNPLYPVPVLMNAKELSRFYYEVMPRGAGDRSGKKPDPQNKKNKAPNNTNKTVKDNNPDKDIDTGKN